jgi:hypothetical protein
VNYRFLCSSHRTYLHQNPSRAVAFWQTGFDTAQVFCDDGQWSEALPHIGCAYEAAEIILTTKPIVTAGTFELMTSSTVLLAFTFLKLGNEEDARDVYLASIKRLENELLTGAAYAEVQPTLSFLYRCIQNLMANFKVPQPSVHQLQESGAILGALH